MNFISLFSNMGGFNFVEGIMLLLILGTGRLPSKRTETERTVMADGRQNELFSR